MLMVRTNKSTPVLVGSDPSAKEVPGRNTYSAKLMRRNIKSYNNNMPKNIANSARKIIIAAAE